MAEQILSQNEIDAVASTAGPGLIVCLSVGLSFGKAFASAINKPFIAVNHLEGHALSPRLNNELNYPYLLLLISGGHSQYLSVQGLGKYKRLGTTIDDALGEAFDKTAKLLGIEFPGGPQIEVLAKKGNPEKYDLPKPIFNKGGCNLSFAGLKTAILKIAKSIKTDQEKFDLAASFQKTVEEILNKKTRISSIPPLRHNGAWITDAQEKANLFVSSWTAKIKLPQEIDDPFFTAPEQIHSMTFIVRARLILKELLHLDESKATGPDNIGAKILKRLAHELAVPIAKLCQRILNEGRWPDCWRVHHLVPIFKRGSAFLANNYRGG